MAPNLRQSVPKKIAIFAKRKGNHIRARNIANFAAPMCVRTHRWMPYIHTYIHTYLLTYLLAYLHTYILANLHTYILTYLHTDILTYMHAYGIQTHIYADIHTWQRYIESCCDSYIASYYITSHLLCITLHYIRYIQYNTTQSNTIPSIHPLHHLALHIVDFSELG